MSIYESDYLRIKKPRTQDGTNPVFENGVQQFKWVDAPLSAKAFYESQNNVLPTMLKREITVVKAYKAPPQPTVDVDALQARIKELEAQAAAKPKKEKTETV